MRTPAHDTALFLAGLTGFGAFGGASSWSVHVGREPLTPVNVVTCYDTGGAPGPLVDLRTPTVQVRVRASNYDAGWQKANEAYATLVQVTKQAVTDANILAWSPSGEVTYIGRDDKDRPLFTVNFEMLRDGAAA